MTARREYVLSLLLGAVGAGLVLLSVRQGWARVVTPAPIPLPATSVRVSGQDLVPVAGALGLASLAGLAAVAATRRRARRLTGLVLAVFGLVTIVSVGTHITTSAVLASARGAGPPAAGSATSGGTAGAAPGVIPGGTTPGVTAAGHVTFAGFPWHAAALTGALLIVVAGLLTLWRGGRWPAMSSRYDRAQRTAAGTAAGPAVPPDSTAALWDALSRGADPTESPAGSGEGAATDGTALHHRG